LEQQCGLGHTNLARKGFFHPRGELFDDVVSERSPSQVSIMDGYFILLGFRAKVLIGKNAQREAH
jgi:hypothetical protein